MIVIHKRGNPGTLWGFKEFKWASYIVDFCADNSWDAPDFKEEFTLWADENLSGKFDWYLEHLGYVAFEKEEDVIIARLRWS